MKHLYIIGNGFDLHHRMKTSYSQFREWLGEMNENTISKEKEYTYGRRKRH